MVSQAKWIFTETKHARFYIASCGCDGKAVGECNIWNWECYGISFIFTPEKEPQALPELDIFVIIYCSAVEFVTTSQIGWMYLERMCIFFRCVAASVFCTQSTVTRVGINETRHLVKLESAPVSILKWRLNYPLILLIWNDMNRFS